MAKKILIIEDDEDIGDLLANRLRINGFQIAFASEGQRGLDLIKEERPDLIILDLMLPNVPGEVICKEIREHQDLGIASLPIIMLSAKSSEMDQMIGRVIGANAYFSKPFDADHLLAQINHFLN